MKLHPIDRRVVSASQLNADAASYAGGGIYNLGTNVTIEATSISADSAQVGGVWNGGSITIVSGSTLNSDTASGVQEYGSYYNPQYSLGGGALFNAAGATAVVTGSSLDGDSSTYVGGGIDNHGTAIVDSDTLMSDTAQEGGAFSD